MEVKMRIIGNCIAYLFAHCVLLLAIFHTSLQEDVTEVTEYPITLEPPLQDSPVTEFSQRDVDSIILSNSSGETEFPIVNKCCPFNWVYDDGECAKVEILNGSNGSNGSQSQGEGPAWETPKTIVTLAKSFHTFNMTEVLGDPAVFRLSVGKPNCTSTRMEITHNDLMSGADNLDSVLALSPNGYLLWSDEGSSSVHQIPSDEFCIDQLKGNETYVAVFCSPPCDEKHPCVRKCCNPDAILYNNSCMLSTRQWEPFFYSSPGQSQTVQVPIHYRIGVPNCEYYSVSLRTEPSEKAYLLLNGTLVLDTSGRKVFYEPDTFCIDGSLVYGEYDKAVEYPYTVDYSGQELDQTVILCYNPADEFVGQDPEDWRLILYACVTLISSFFLLLTALVFLALWEYQNIHGWLQFCYVLSLLFAFTFLAVVQLSSDTIQEISSVCCKMIGAFIHFLFLSAFFWLTSMNFDLWWTFSGWRPMSASGSTREIKRFLCFGLFSYGVPGLIACVGLILDSLYRDNPYIITPRFGDRYCYFYGDKEKLPYFYGPVGILLTINSVFFISTIYSLHKLQNDTKFATKQSSKQEKKRFLLFMKLFVVMGVMWIFEVISWATMTFNHNYQYIKNIFLVTDLLIGAQGIAIFVIFTCKPNTCRQLEAQVRRLSQYLQQKKDRTTVNTSTLNIGYLVVGVCTVLIPLLNGVRCLFGQCSRRTSRTLDGRRSHTNTITSSVWDRPRKIDKISITALSSLDIELDFRSSLSKVPSRNEASSSLSSIPET